IDLVSLPKRAPELIIVILFDAPCPVSAPALAEFPPIAGHLDPVDDPANKANKPKGQHDKGEDDDKLPIPHHRVQEQADCIQKSQGQPRPAPDKAGGFAEPPTGFSQLAAVELSFQRTRELENHDQ